jgi:hypothetical protein
MANPLDWAARAILQINGMKPEEIKQRARQLKAGKGKKPMPKANTKAAKPQVQAPDPGPNSRAQGRNLIKEGANSLKKPKPPARPKPGSTQVQGQTNLMNKEGKARDFRNPRVSANRQPTTTPVQSRSSAQATSPNRPAGGFGNKPAGQGELFGKNPNAKPGGNYKAPNVPKAGTATKPPAKPAPQVKTNPVSRTGPVKGPAAPKPNAAVRLPNSAAQGKNLINEGAKNLRNTTQGPTLKGTAPVARAAANGGRLAGAARVAGAVSTAASVASIPVIAAQGLKDSIRVTKEDQAKRNAAIAKAQADRKTKEQRDAKVRAEQSKKRVNNGTWNQTPSIVPTKKK